MMELALIASSLRKLRQTRRAKLKDQIREGGSLEENVDQPSSADSSRICGPELWASRDYLLPRET
jgi:hypothetical protein